MAINYPNWFAAPRLELPDIIGEYMKGYRASKEPAAMRRQEEQERIANALKGLELQYAPEQYQQEALSRGLDIEKGRMENKYYPQTQEADIAYKRGQIAGQPIERALMQAQIAKAVAEANAEQNPSQAAYLKTLAQEQAKSDVEDANSRATILESTYKAGDLLGGYDSIIEDPEFMNTVGKTNTAKLYTSKWVGGNEDRLDLQAQIDYISGMFKDQIIKGYKGALSDYEQQEGLRRVPNYKDDPASFKAKKALMSKLNDSVQQRVTLIDQLRRQGVSKIDALKAAQKAFPIDFNEKSVVDEYEGAVPL